VAYIAADRTASSFAPTDIVFATGTSAGVSEKARLDSSGRLLVGTSSDQSESDATGLIQAFHSSAGKIIIGREDSTVSTGDYIGIIDFRSTDGGSQRTARIAAQADGDHGANDKPGRLVFSTTADGASSPTERFRINKNGILYSANHSVHLGVEGSTMSGGGRFTVHGDFYSGTAGAAFSTTNNTNGAIYIQFGNSTGTKIGSITRASSTSVAYNTTSDYRLKENVLPIQAATQLISQLRPVSYNFIGHADEQSTGFIAHELQEVIPEAVTGEKDAAHADGSPNYQGVDLSKLVPLLTAALQEALAEIESLKARVTALEP